MSFRSLTLRELNSWQSDYPIILFPKTIILSPEFTLVHRKSTTRVQANFPRSCHRSYRVYFLRLCGLGFIALLLLAFFLKPVSVFATPETQAGLSMQADPAFDGNYKYGEWLPVWVELENQGPDLQAEINVRVTGSQASMVFSVPIELPTTSRKRLPVFVLANNFSRELEVQLTTQDQQQTLLASKKVAVRPRPNVSYLIGILATQRGALSLLNGVKFPGIERPKVILDLQLSELPERFEGLRSFDCIIINDIDTSSLTPEQGVALENWVRQGGRLVVGGGSGAQHTVAGLPQSLLPITLQDSTTLTTLSALERFAATSGEQPEGPPILVPGPFVAATGDVSSSRVLAAQQDLPLLLEMPLGRGYVDFVALDLSATPFDGWAGTTNFWSNLLGPSAIYPNWLPQDVSTRRQVADQMPYTLANLPMLDLPSTKGLALLLGVYILLVGPANYLILRWRKRLHWAWITIPLITLIFSAGAFGLGYILHGTDVFLNKIAIIDLDPDGKAIVNSYLGLFSPSQTAYEIEIDGGETAGLVSPLSPFYNPWESFAPPQGYATTRQVVLQQGNPAYVHGLSVEQWSMQSFLVEGLALDFGQVHVDLRLQGQTFEGTVRNDSPHALLDAVIIIGATNKSFVRLGDLPPGKEVEVEISFSNLFANDFGPPLSYRLFEEQFSQPDSTRSSSSATLRQVEVKRMVLENVLDRTPAFISSVKPGTAGAGGGQTPLLLAWLDEAPPSTRISGTKPAQQTTALLLMPLSYKLPDSGSIELRAGMIPGMLTQYPVDGGMCGEPGSTAVYLFRGEAIFEFSVPLEIQDIHIEHLKLSLTTDSNWFGSPSVALYDWVEDQWLELTGITNGINLVPGSANLVNSAGIVRLRITGDGTSQGCYYVNLGLEGYR